MNENVVSGPCLLIVRVTESVASRVLPVSASSPESSESSLSRSAEDEFLHLFVEVEASEDSASCSYIKSYDSSDHQGLLQKRATFVAYAATAGGSFEQRSCCNTEEW